MKPTTRVLLTLALGISTAHAQQEPRAAPEQPARAAAESPAQPAAPPREPRVDLAALIERVAAQARRQVVLDPRLPRDVFIGDVSADEVDYPMLLAILRVHGWFATEIDGRLFILPVANARQTPLRLLQRDDPNVSDHEYVTRVLRVSNEESPRARDEQGREREWSARADMLVRVLRVLISVEGHLAAAGDDLILIERYDNVRRITALVDALAQ
jgi:hypothetical protein